MKEWSDQELLAHVANNDTQAFTLLLRRYWNIVYSHALAYLKSIHLAEEITQDVFMNIWRARERLMVIESFENYLFITTRNRIYNETRKKIVEQYGQELEEMADNHSGAEATEYKETYQILLEGIEALPEKRRQVFRMSKLEGMSNDQIAKELGMHRDTVYQYLTKAVSFLKIYLQDRSGDTLVVLLLLTCGNNF